MSEKPLRFVFHVGAGKTGTSSIQNTLRKSVDLLKTQGIWYQGLMFEHAPVVKYPWQLASGSEAFHTTDPKQASAELGDIVRATVLAARQAGAHTIIWSNESFFDRNDKTRETLHGLIADGIDVRLIAYVRRHDAWSRSAYIQWAIKHKTNIGPVLRFQDWVKRRPVKFAPALQSLQAAFPGRLQVRNLDVVKDAVADFLMLLEIKPDQLDVVRDNVSPDSVEILLRALFNTRTKEKVLPVRFDRMIARNADFTRTPVDYLRSMLPSDSDLRDVREASAEDRSAVDALLKACRQQGIATDELPGRRIEINDGQLLFTLAQLVMQHAQRIERLEIALKRLGHPVDKTIQD